jgi:sporulation protein YlmC with PRC-barrel domain
MIIRKSVLATAAALSVVALAGGSYAGGDKSQKSDMKSSSAAGTSGYTAASFDKLKGMKVQDRSGQEVGSISDAVFDTHSGRVEFFVLSPSSALGTEHKRIAIPVQGMHFQHDQKFATLNVDREKLKNAPEARADMSYTRDFARQVDQYYGISPSFGGSGTGSSMGSGSSGDTMRKDSSTYRDMGSSGSGSSGTSSGTSR